jgi:hypothetical protein
VQGSRRKKQPPWIVGNSKAAGTIGFKSWCEFVYAFEAGFNRNPPRMFNQGSIHWSAIKIVRFIGRSERHGDPQSLLSFLESQVIIFAKPTGCNPWAWVDFHYKSGFPFQIAILII